jgi:hypothetical protein
MPWTNSNVASSQFKCGSRVDANCKTAKELSHITNWMTELGRFLPLTRVGVSKNYVRNDVITAKNCFATLLANINTEVCQPWQETTQRVGKISTVQTTGTDTLALDDLCTRHWIHTHNYSVRVYWLTTVWIYKVNCVENMNKVSFKFFALRTKYSVLNQCWLEKPSYANI